MDLYRCMAPHREHTSKALRNGTRSQVISQFYLHTPRLSANGINHCFPAEADPHLQRDGSLNWPEWLVTYQNKCPAPSVLQLDDIHSNF